jgi:hypothetical protein
MRLSLGHGSAIGSRNASMMDLMLAGNCDTLKQFSFKMQLSFFGIGRNLPVHCDLSRSRY